MIELKNDSLSAKKKRDFSIANSNNLFIHSKQNSFNNEIKFPEIIEISNKKSNNSLFIEKRYCTICYIDQPLRAKHCKICKKCVAMYDHHCPWMGNFNLKKLFFILKKNNAIEEFEIYIFKKKFI